MNVCIYGNGGACMCGYLNTTIHVTMDSCVSQDLAGTPARTPPAHKRRQQPATNGATTGTPPRQKPGHHLAHGRTTGGSSRGTRRDTNGATKGGRNNIICIRRKLRPPTRKRASSHTHTHTRHARHEHGRRLRGRILHDRTRGRRDGQCLLRGCPRRARECIR